MDKDPRYVLVEVCDAKHEGVVKDVCFVANEIKEMKHSLERFYNKAFWLFVTCCGSLIGNILIQIYFKEHP